MGHSPTPQGKLGAPQFDQEVRPPEAFYLNRGCHPAGGACPSADPVACQRSIVADGVRVVIVGDGAMATALAIELGEQQTELGARVVEEIVIVGPSEAKGRGLAYACGDRPWFTVNARTNDMNLTRDPDHLEEWLRGRGISVGPDFYSTRHLYGEYVEDCLRNAEADLAGVGTAMTLVSATVTRVQVCGERVGVCLLDGRIIVADRVILAIGHLKPRLHEYFEGSPGYVGDPYGQDFVGRFDPSAPTIVVGASLTAIDFVKAAIGLGGTAPILLASRTGILPAVRIRASDARPAEIRHVRSLAERGNATITNSSPRFTTMCWSTTENAKGSKTCSALPPAGGDQRPATLSQIADVCRRGKRHTRTF